MKKTLQEEELNTEENMQQVAAPVKRKRGRPPLKNKNLNSLSDNKKTQRASETQNLKIQNESNILSFQYPPQIPFIEFNLGQDLKKSTISTQFFQNIINNILSLWWNGSFPVLFDDSNIIKFELVFNIFQFLKKVFNYFPPFLIITDSNHTNQWLSTFIGTNSYLFSDNENDTESDIYYTNKSKAKLDVLILSNDQDLSTFSNKTFSILIIDQSANFDNFSYLDEFDIKNRFLICNSNAVNIPSVFDIEHSISVTLDDLKTHKYISEILHFCPMTQFQIRQTQQLFKTNKTRLHQIPEPLSERLAMFLSHMVQQVKSISVHPSLSVSYNGTEDQSGKFQELLKIVIDLQISNNKIAVIGCDPKLLTFTTSFFIKNKINAYNVNHLLKEKKKAQLINKFNESDSSYLLLIGPDDFSQYYDKLIIDKIIILEVDINLISMIDEILAWQQSQHYNKPEIIRLITDNSIELPIYDMQLEEENENKAENQGEEEEKKEDKKSKNIKAEANKSHSFDLDKMKSETLLLLLKQSASLCFESAGEQVKQPIEVCYSQPQKLFDIETNFNSNFWNNITQIEFQDHQLQKQQQQKFSKQNFHLRSSKELETNSEDSSIATRVKKELMRRTRQNDQEMLTIIKPEKSKISAKKEAKNSISRKKLMKKRKSQLKRNQNISEGDEEEENEYLNEAEEEEEREYESSDDESKQKKKLKKKKNSNKKLRKSILRKNAKKEKEEQNEYESDAEANENDVENEEEQNEYDQEKKGKDLEENADEEEDEEEEEEEEVQEENLLEESENEEGDENASIASREKKRRLKKEQLKTKLKNQSKSSKQTKSSSKITKRSKKLENRRILERDAQQKVRQRQAQLLQKPRKHIPKFEAMVSFWNLRHFTHYLEILREYGFDRWDKFASFERPIQELRKIGALIIRNLETTSRENRLLREYFANELRSSELSRLDNALPFVRRKLAKAVVRNEFLADLTGMLVIAKQAPRTAKDIVLPRIAEGMEPLDNEWTEEDDKTLLFLIHENGLYHIPTTFKHNLSKSFLKRFRSFFSIDPSNQANYIKNNSNNAENNNEIASNASIKAKGANNTLEAKSSIKKKNSPIKGKTQSFYQHASSSNAAQSLTKSTKAARAIGLKQHSAIIHNLCSYGYPDLLRFKAQMNPNVVNLSDSDLQDYIDNIFNFCTCTIKDERKVLAQKIIGKIEKYTSTKIINRKNMFEKLREDAVSYDKISAEDTELLSAMSFHGFQNTDNSPILLSSCGGECSDQRLFQRVKAISMQEQIKNEEKLPDIFGDEEIENTTNINEPEPIITNDEINQQTNENDENNQNPEENIKVNEEDTNIIITNNESQEEINNDNINTENNNNVEIDNQQANEINQDNQPLSAESVAPLEAEIPIDQNVLEVPVESEEPFFPLKLNDRQMLKAIGTIDPRFHDEDHIYPVGYESSVACINPFADSNNTVWLNLTVRLLNTKIDKKDKNNKNGDFLLFVVRKEKEKSAEISDDTPDKVFEKVRQRIIRKTKTWMPPFDGNEMFGFNSSKVHRIFLQMPNIEACTNYRRRFFRLPMTIEHEWPIIGRYEDKRKQMQMYTMFTNPAEANGINVKNINNADDPSSQNEASAMNQKQKQNAKKMKHLNLKKNLKNKNNLKLNSGEKSAFSMMKKKEFGSLMKPLVIDCRPIFNLENEEASVSVCGSSIGFKELMQRYEKWDEDIISKYIPQAASKDHE